MKINKIYAKLVLISFLVFFLSGCIFSAPEYCESNKDCIPDGCGEIIISDAICVCNTETKRCEQQRASSTIVNYSCDSINNAFYIEDDFIFSKGSGEKCKINKVSAPTDPSYSMGEKDIKKEINYKINIDADCAKKINKPSGEIFVDLNENIYSCLGLMGE